MKKEKTKAGQIIGTLIKSAIKFAVPGGHILANIAGDNGSLPGRIDKQRSWQDVAIEISKILAYLIAAKYGLDLADLG